MAPCRYKSEEHHEHPQWSTRSSGRGLSALTTRQPLPVFRLSEHHPQRSFRAASEPNESQRRVNMPFTPENPARVGLIGCGNIAGRYFTGMARFPTLSVVGCADLFPDVAARFASSTGITAYPSIAGLLADPDIDLVVNITPPSAHAQISIDALRAGKHVYVEKPLAATLADGRLMVAAATQTGQRLGSAPDTFLGSAAQTARRAIDDGLIGSAVGATAFITHSKAETWHPDPTFLFKPGGGPVLDLGPYYVSVLVNCLGPVAQVAAFTRIGAPTRTVTSPDRRVDSIDVQTATHATALLKFESGVLATLMFSFDVWNHHLPFIEIYGEAGALALSDPNEYDGDVLVRGNYEDSWSVLPPELSRSGEPGTPTQLLRGMGVADLAAAVDGAAHRTNSELGLHILEILEAVGTASATESVVSIHSRVERPAAILRSSIAHA